MAKILHFPKSDAQTPEAFLEETKQAINNDAQAIIIVVKNKSGEVITGYYDCDFSTRHELVGHIQCDIIDQMIRANTDRYCGG